MFLQNAFLWPWNGTSCKSVCDHIDLVYGEQAPFVFYPFFHIVCTNVCWKQCHGL